MEADGSRHKQQDELILLETLFVRAAGGDNDALNNYLMRNGNINRRDGDGMSLMHYAACNGSIRLIHQLKQYGAEVNLPDEGSPAWKPVHYAIFHRQHDAEKLLIELGAQAPLPLVKRVVVEGRDAGPRVIPVLRAPKTNGERIQPSAKRASVRRPWEPSRICRRSGGEAECSPGVGEVFSLKSLRPLISSNER